MQNEKGDEPNQQRARKALMEQLKRQQIELQKKEIAKRMLDAQAYERLMNIRASNPDLYMQLLDLIISVVQQNRVTGKITEAQFVELLGKITYRREPTLEFKHK